MRSILLLVLACADTNHYSDWTVQSLLISRAPADELLCSPPRRLPPRARRIDFIRHSIEPRVREVTTHEV